jgi:mono/diheme cytochrome c family protein
MLRFEPYSLLALSLTVVGRLAMAADPPVPPAIPQLVAPTVHPPAPTISPPATNNLRVVPAPAARILPAPPITRTNLPEVLAFDALMKDYTAKTGELSATLTFNVTNISPSEVVINNVRTSCGCTVAQVPGHPWRLAPGTNGQFSVVADLRGKFGTLMKSIFVDGSTTNQPFFTKTLGIRLKLPDNPMLTMVANSRNRNQQVALADRQAALKGDCAKCHVEPGTGKLGEALYAATCAVCHDAIHRASMVPDLRALDHPADWAHWRQWVTHGKVGSLMPAFAKSEGGVFSEEEIDSLVQYLSKNFPAYPKVRPTVALAPLPPPFPQTEPKRPNPGASKN